VNDIKDIRENPEKYRQGLRDRTNAAQLAKDPQAAEKNAAEIDELLRIDKGARLAKTLVQNLQAQSNIDTSLVELYVSRKKPLPEDVKEAKAAKYREELKRLQDEALPLRIALNEWQQDDIARQIAWCDAGIARHEAKVAELEQKEAEILAPHTALLEEIVEEIKRKDFFLQKGRGEGSIK
jgi:seryl-tRNA synthetase